MGNAAFDPMRAYGAGAIALRGGFCPYGSTAGGYLPVVPSVAGADPTGGSRPRWGAFWAAHDGVQVGKYQVTLDQDYQDLKVDADVLVNRKHAVASVFMPSHTSGHGLTFYANAPGTAGNLISVIYATPSGSLSAAYSGNVVTITPATGGSTNAAIAAYINSATGQTAVNSLIVASAGDTDTVTASTGAHYLAGGTSSEDESYASVLIGSDTASDGILYAARTPGAIGNGIVIVYVFSGTSAPAVAVTDGSIITVTIATATGSTTNASIAAAINASAAASALVSASWVGSGADTNTTTTVRVDGTPRAGGGMPVVRVGDLDPSALTDSGVLSIESMLTAQKAALPGSDPWSHFALKVYLGDTPTDLDARSTLFVPSATQGSGVMFSSSATVPTKASVSILSTSGAGYGVKFTAVQPGIGGNAISVVYQSPYAQLFIPSTTAGSGVTFTAVAVGSSQQVISVSMAAPNPNLTTAQVVVNGTAIAIYPQSGNGSGADTNTSIATAIGNSPAAAALVTAAATGSGSDLVTGNFNAQRLGGGYALAAASVTAQISGSSFGGWEVTVQFGANATNTSVANAVNAVAAGQNDVVSAAVIGSSGSDHVVVASGVLSGGSDPSQLAVQYVGGGLPATLPATVAGNAGTITVNSTTSFPTAGTLNIVNSAGAIIQIAYTGTTSTTFTGCTGGSSSYNFNSGAIAYLDTVAAVQGSSLTTVYLGFTAANNTNASIATAVNEVQPGAATLLSAAYVGTSTDLNPVLPSGKLSWGARGQPAQLPLVCQNLVLFEVFARNSAAIGP